MGAEGFHGDRMGVFELAVAIGDGVIGTEVLDEWKGVTGINVHAQFAVLYQIVPGCDGRTFVQDAHRVSGDVIVLEEAMSIMDTYRLIIG